MKLYRSVRGFTLVELLVVLTIVALIAGVTLPVVATTWASRRIDSAARLVQGELTAAVARAQRDGFAGVRLIPDPAFPLKRLADGRIDPAAPLAYSRAVPLFRPDAIADGLVTIHDSFPAGFPTGALLIEQEVKRDEGGVRILNEPTSWAWRVRLGDQFELADRTYTVCGPMDEINPEGFVNYPATGTGLDRGDGPAEWLALVNGRDDDGDGSIDNGFNGRDDDLDGTVDNPEEWTETETWGLTAPVVASGYRIRPRPVQSAGSTGVDLGGAVIDATGWDSASPPRSRLPVDRLSGVVDLIVWPDGRVEPVNRHAPTAPAVGVLARPHLHFWVSDRESVDSTAPGVGRLVTVNSRTGLIASGEADPADAAVAYREAEGGGL